MEFIGCSVFLYCIYEKCKQNWYNSRYLFIFNPILIPLMCFTYLLSGGLLQNERTKKNFGWTFCRSKSTRGLSNIKYCFICFYFFCNLGSIIVTNLHRHFDYFPCFSTTKKIVHSIFGLRGIAGSWKIRFD